MNVFAFDGWNGRWGSGRWSSNAWGRRRRIGKWLHAFTTRFRGFHFMFHFCNVFIKFLYWIHLLLMMCSRRLNAWRSGWCVGSDRWWSWWRTERNFVDPNVWGWGWERWNWRCCIWIGHRNDGKIKHANKRNKRKKQPSDLSDCSVCVFALRICVWTASEVQCNARGVISYGERGHLRNKPRALPNCCYARGYRLYLWTCRYVSKPVGRDSYRAIDYRCCKAVCGLRSAELTNSTVLNLARLALATVMQCTYQMNDTHTTPAEKQLP